MYLSHMWGRSWFKGQWFPWLTIENLKLWAYLQTMLETSQREQALLITESGGTRTAIGLVLVRSALSNWAIEAVKSYRKKFGCNWYFCKETNAFCAIIITTPHYYTKIAHCINTYATSDMIHVVINWKIWLYWTINMNTVYIRLSYMYNNSY